jgi:hypothetical protein
LASLSPLLGYRSISFHWGRTPKPPGYRNIDTFSIISAFPFCNLLMSLQIVTDKEPLRAKIFTKNFGKVFFP